MAIQGSICLDSGEAWLGAWELGAAGFFGRRNQELGKSGAVLEVAAGGFEGTRFREWRWVVVVTERLEGSGGVGEWGCEFG